MIWILRTLALGSCLVLGLSVTSCGGDEDDGGEDGSGPMATGSDCNCDLCYCIGLDCPPAPECCETGCPAPDGGPPAGADGGTSPIDVRPGGGGPRPGPVTVDCGSAHEGGTDAQCRSRCDTNCEEGEEQNTCKQRCCTRHSDFAECVACCAESLAGPTLGSQRGCNTLCQVQMRER